MLFLIAAVIFLLEGLHVINSTADITWWLIGLGILALAFILDVFVPALGVRHWRRSDP